MELKIQLNITYNNEWMMSFILYRDNKCTVLNLIHSIPTFVSNKLK